MWSDQVMGRNTFGREGTFKARFAERDTGKEGMIDSPYSIGGWICAAPRHRGIAEIGVESRDGRSQPPAPSAEFSGGCNHKIGSTLSSDRGLLWVWGSSRLIGWSWSAHRGGRLCPSLFQRIVDQQFSLETRQYCSSKVLFFNFGHSLQPHRFMNSGAMQSRMD